jgi:hypothetical protein
VESFRRLARVATLLATSANILLAHFCEEAPPPPARKAIVGNIHCSSQRTWQLLYWNGNPRPSNPPWDVGILFNGVIGVLFFASFVSRMGDIQSAGGMPGIFDFFPIIFFLRLPLTISKEVMMAADQVYMWPTKSFALHLCSFRGLTTTYRSSPGS